MQKTTNKANLLAYITTIFISRYERMKKLKKSFQNLELHGMRHQEQS